MADTPGPQGETLAARLTRGPIERDVALDILERVLKSVAFLHWSGVAHGNITPKAIFLSPEGDVALTGAPAGRPAVAAPANAEGRTSLDPRYLAPEQVRREAPDARTDVFAVGVIAYEMLTGRDPFGASDGLGGREIMSRIVNAPTPQLPEAVAQALPPRVVEALDIALAKDRDARFAGAENFLEALRSPDAPGAQSAASTPSNVGPRRRRHWFRYFGPPLILAGIVAAVVLALLFYQHKLGNPLQAATTVPPTSTSAVTTTEPAPTSTTAPPTTTTEAPTTTTTTEAVTTTVPAPVVKRVEETEAGLAYTGSWSNGSDTSSSDGRFRYSKGSNAAVSVTFTGASFAWIAKTGTTYGIAQVTLDDGAPVPVDLYAANTLYQQKVWDSGTLPGGLHVVKIEWTGEKNAAASGAGICLDAFDVAGEVVALTRFEDTDERLNWAGTWKSTPTSSASGKSFKYADSAGATVTADFTGRALSIVAKKGPNYGQAKITLDSAQTFTVDLYSADAQMAATVWSSGLLTQGAHSVKIEWTGAKNAASSGTNISVDAFDVIGTLR